MTRFRLPLSLLAVAVLAGCASVEPGAALKNVQSLTKTHTDQTLTVHRSPEDLTRTNDKVAELLRQPLGVDAAVQIALLNNRSLQARLQQLGITEAEVSQASRLPNPGFSFGRLTRGDEVELERGLHINLARLLTLPLVSRLEERRLQSVQRLSLIHI